MNEPDKPTIAVIIPCYRVAAHLEQVLDSIHHMVDHTIVVDDCCPEESWKIAEAVQVRDARVQVLRHEVNRGVGGAMITGYKRALAMGCDIIIKMDGDGQMDPAQILDLVAPLEQDRADYTKGSRFRDFRALKRMPKVRLFGNTLLSFFVKAASGYWSIVDPTNGYTAIHRRVLTKLNLDKLSEDYFFESDMLVNLNVVGATVHDIPMPAQYGSEVSSLSVRSAALRFPLKLCGRLIKRIFLQYFVYDFNMASVYILAGLPMFLFGLVFGTVEWISSIATGIPRTAGTIMVATLPIVLGFQMLLQAIQIDIDRVPKRRDS
ncbi:glycosyltransferase family 2 protein [Thermodesulfobacteriota bacterium]